MARQRAERSPADIEDVIHEAVRLLVEAAHPDKIILFGSHARGDFDEDSDLDLLVIMPTVEDRFEEMMRLERLLPLYNCRPMCSCPQRTMYGNVDTSVKRPSITR